MRWNTALNAADKQPYENAVVESFDETGRKLPAGVPKVVDTNGTLQFIDRHFTTPAYQEEALHLIIREANNVAAALNLPEKLPIVVSNLTTFHVSPFGFAYGYKMIGNITTKKYIYGIACGNKFNLVGIANYEKACLALVESQPLEKSKIDTNAAYYMASNWLSQAAIDVAGLNRDCTRHVELSPFWNSHVSVKDRKQNKFFPFYTVSWTYPQDTTQEHGGAAEVEIYTPTKMLLQLSFSDPKYILRKPVVFTNLAALFPGVAPIHTNHPVKPVYLDASKMFGPN